MICPEIIQPYNIKIRDIFWRRYKLQEPLYIGKWCLSPLQSRHVGTSHSSPSFPSTVENTLQNPLLESPSTAPSHFPESHQHSEISSLSKVILVLGKAKVVGAKSGLRMGSSHQGRPSLLTAAHTRSTFLGVLLGAGLWECGSLSTDSQPSLKHLCRTLIYPALITSSPKAFRIIQIVSTEEGSSLTQNLMQIPCSTSSVIFNEMATQYTCSLNSVYCPHCLVQWNCRSRMFIPVHSPWLPGYMDVTQTVLVILTMAGLFLDRPCI